MSGPIDPVQAAQLRDASIDGFTAVSRESLTAYAEWVNSAQVKRNCHCEACAIVWAFVAGQLAMCVEGLLGVIDAACLPVGGRHEPRPDPYLPDHQENPRG